MAGIEAVGDVDEDATQDATQRDDGMDGVLLRARGLTKRFGDFTAVDGIDVEVRAGESFGFLGPNGAGKSSTMKMIGCVSPVTAGELRIFGLDPATDGAAIRARLGVCPQEDMLDGELTVEENLWIYGRYFGLSRREAKDRAVQLLDFAQLTERRGDRVEPLSGGMKRRLTIARSLISKPELLLLDEPTTGLDPQARHLLWDRLFRLKRQGVTLIVTTHYMDEAEQLCDRLVVMDGGRIADEGSPRQLIERHCSREVLELRFDAELDAAPTDPATDATTDAPTIAARLVDIGDRVEVLPDRVLVYADDGEAALATVHARGVRPMSSLVRRASLEDVFLHLTGRSLVD
ncbi:MAG: ABC transporter ATP-binding protein [Kineosporiaceae bacterium]